MELCRYHRKLLSSKNASSDRDDARPKTTPSVHVHINEKDIIATGMTVLGCVVGVALLLCILYLALTFYRQRNGRGRTTTTSVPIVSGPLADFSDELQNSEELGDHHIWYINSIGLSQSVIDSISLFKYKKDQGLIDGTECSVCLNEFQEDDTLRLLPKCSHAFHLPCIDTWLRSHKTCPLCRAPVVSDSFNDEQVAPSQPTTTDLDWRAESQMEIDGDDNDCLPIEDGMDLVDSLQEAPDEAQKQPVRRTLSLDSTSTLAIYNVMANITPGSSDSLLVRPKCWKWKNSYKRGNTSFHKYAVSDLQKLPISTMKRSASSSEKFSLSRQSKNKESGCSI